MGLASRHDRCAMTKLCALSASPLAWPPGATRLLADGLERPSLCRRSVAHNSCVTVRGNGVGKHVESGHPCLSCTGPGFWAWACSVVSAARPTGSSPASSAIRRSGRTYPQGGSRRQHLPLRRRTDERAGASSVNSRIDVVHAVNHAGRDSARRSFRSGRAQRCPKSHLPRPSRTGMRSMRNSAALIDDCGWRKAEDRPPHGPGKSQATSCCVVRYFSV